MVCLFREEKLGRKRKNSRGTSRSTTQNRSKNKINLV
jgi:hypothetical protein